MVVWGSQKLIGGVSQNEEVVKIRGSSVMIQKRRGNLKKDV